MKYSPSKKYNISVKQDLPIKYNIFIQYNLSKKYYPNSLTVAAAQLFENKFPLPGEI